MKVTKPEKPFTAPAAPADLSEASQSLWQSAVLAGCRSPGRQMLLEQALRALDRAEQCRCLLASEGLTSVTKATGAVHLHPAAKLERESRQVFARLWETLCLHFNQKEDFRPNPYTFHEGESE